MAKRFQMPFAQWVNTNSVVQAGAKLEFFESGTSTQLDTFTDETGATANANPVIADGAGQFPAIFLEARDYKVTLKTSDDTLIWTADPVIGGVEGTGQLLRRGYMDGFQLVNGPSDTDHDITFGAGECQDSTNTSALNLASSLVKQIDATWAEGTNLGGRASAVSLSNNTWYHCFVLLNTATSAVDAGFDTSVSANNLLDDATGFTKFRRVGSVLTDGSANILAFVQRGGWFLWDTVQRNLNATNPGTSVQTVSLSVPPDVRVMARFAVYWAAAADPAYMRIAEGGQSLAAASDAFSLSQDAGDAFTTMWEQWTDTSNQITYDLTVSAAGTEVQMITHGWYDLRGKDS